MFQSFVSQTRRPVVWSMQTLKFASKAPVSRPHRFKEINEVKMVGTLTTDSYALQSGRKLLTVETKESPEKHSIHNVHYVTETHLLAGLRIYITGKLRSTSTQTTEGKTLTNSFVKANKVFVLENKFGLAYDLIDGDTNSVKLIGYIASDVVIRNGESFFSVTTNQHTLDENKKEVIRTYYHRVCAHNDTFRRYVQDNNNFKKNDAVLIYGRIDHNNCIEFDDKEIESGCFVVANNIFKVDEVKVDV